MAKKIKNKIHYDAKSDALWLFIKEGKEFASKEVAPGITIELGKNNELLGIEILNASKIFNQKIKKETDKQDFVTT
jgi:uncharacterized protein YuzE